eukprot:COSAG02_NODE_1737_length_11150_cov_15.164420_9_plen_163_part_01
MRGEFHDSTKSQGEIRPRLTAPAYIRNLPRHLSLSLSPCTATTAADAEFLTRCMTVPYGSFRGDIVWNVGTGYFGCRDRDGNFCIDMFKDTAALPQLKMVEIKLSQGCEHALSVPPILQCQITDYIAAIDTIMCVVQGEAWTRWDFTTLEAHPGSLWNREIPP